MIETKAKQQIKINFEKKALDYDKYALIQNDIFKKMYAQIDFEYIEKGLFVDYGCGNGTNTLKLTQQCNPIHAVDLINKSNVHQSKSILYQQTDFDKVLFPNNSVSLLISNMALHWSSNLVHLLKMIYDSFKNNGLLYFSIPIDGTFKEIHNIHRNSFYYLEQVVSFLQEIGYVDINPSIFEYVTYYNSKIEALRSIKNSGSNTVINHQKPRLNKNILHEIMPEVDNNRISLTYKIALFSARKSYDQ